MTAKVPSTPRGPVRGRDGGRRGRRSWRETAAFAHGMTVATNALLERRGARTALVTTRGLPRRDRDRPPGPRRALRPRRAAARRRSCRASCASRVRGADGARRRARAARRGRAWREAVDALREAEVEAVAVCLLFAFLHPEHEQRGRRGGPRGAARTSTSRSPARCCPSSASTSASRTTVGRRLPRPRLARLPASGSPSGADEAGVPAPLVMQSSGGVVDVGTAAERRPPAACSPARPAGWSARRTWRAASGYEDVLTFDMGGTSTDVAPVARRRGADHDRSPVVAGVPIKLPMVDVHTVSAGGGSIAWADAGGALRVGPRSAGADPGPAAYGKRRRGADGHRRQPAARLPRATAPSWAARSTLGREPAEQALARARREARPRRARDRARRRARRQRRDGARAAGRSRVERGLDPREFALVAFGGAGGLHACALAEELGIATRARAARRRRAERARARDLATCAATTSRPLLGALDGSTATRSSARSRSSSSARARTWTTRRCGAAPTCATAASPSS